MRRVGLILLFAALLGCTAPTEASFFVGGSCEECGSVIEEAVTSLPGVDFVSWSVETSTVTVRFDGTEAQLASIQEAIAASGFDTQFFPANAEAQKELPACCHQSKSSLIDPENKKLSPH